MQVRPGYLLGGAKVGPCGSPHRTPQRDTRPSPSISRRFTKRRDRAVYLVAPEKCIPLFPLSVSPYGKQLLLVMLLPFSCHGSSNLNITYFYSPRADMTRDLFGLWPLKRSTNCTCKQLAGGPRDLRGAASHSSPILVQRRFSLRPVWGITAIQAGA